MAKAFTPISVIAGLLAGILANKIFVKIWGKIIDEEPPDPKHREISGYQLVGSLILQGAVQRLVKGGVDHGLRHAVARSRAAGPARSARSPSDRPWWGGGVRRLVDEVAPLLSRTRVAAGVESKEEFAASGGVERWRLAPRDER